MIRFACPGCSASFTVPDEKAGKSGKCPKCQTQFVIPATGDAAPNKPAPAPAAEDQPVEIQPCPKCGERLSVMPGDLGLEIECTNCQTVFKAVKAGSGSKPQSKPPRPSAVEDDEDDRPKSKGKSSRRDDDDEDEDDRPKKKSRRGEDDDEDDRPKSKKGSRRGEDDEDDRPSRRPSKRGEDDENDDRPSKRGSSRGDDEDDDRPSKKGSRRGDDDDDDRPSKRSPKKRKGGGGSMESKKTTAGLLGIFLGAWGVHKFYLGYSTAGIIQIVVTVFTCGTGGIIGFIEGIIYMTKSDEDFIETYQRNEKQWF